MNPKHKNEMPPRPAKRGEGWGEGQREALEVREGPITPYLAKPQQPRHSRAGGNPIPSVPVTDIVALNPRGFDKKPSDDDLVSFIPMKAVEEESGRLSAIDTKRWADVKKGYTPFQDGDVIFAKITPCMENGKYALATGLHGGRAAGSTEFHVFRPKPELDSKYLLHFLFTPELRSRARMNMKGAAGQLRVPTQFFKDVQIPLPPLDEQRRIVAELETQLTRLDASVTALKRVQANLKRYRASVLRTACEGRLVSTEAELARRDGSTYESGVQLLERVREARVAKADGKRKESKELVTADLPELPTGWAWARLDALAALKGGITVDKKRRDETAKAVPYLRVANVQRGYLDLSEIKMIEAPASDIEDLRLMPGDVLFNEGGDRDKLGRGWIWEGQLADCIHQNHVFRARLYLNDLPAKFVSWWGNSFGRDYFQREGKQTTNLASINLGKLSAFPIPIPPLSEQLRIVAEVERRLSVIEELESTVAANLKRANGLRGSILTAALTNP